MSSLEEDSYYSEMSIQVVEEDYRKLQQLARELYGWDAVKWLIEAAVHRLSQLREGHRFVATLDTHWRAGRG